jgi:ABC-type branched-subunit amino acid transport system permease subunit
MLHTLYQLIVSPNLSGIGYTVTAILIILIGGMGTLSSALVGQTEDGCPIFPLPRGKKMED